MPANGSRTRSSTGGSARSRPPGFDQALAARLAEQPQLDLHALLELVDAGCPPPLAARIVEPLDADWGLR